MQMHIPSLTLTLEKSEDVLLPDRSLDVTDDGARGVVHELDAALGNTTTGACSSQIPSLIVSFLLVCIRERRTGAAENAGDLDELDGDLG